MWRVSIPRPTRYCLCHRPLVDTKVLSSVVCLNMRVTCMTSRRRNSSIWESVYDIVTLVTSYQFFKLLIEWPREWNSTSRLTTSYCISVTNLTLYVTILITGAICTVYTSIVSFPADIYLIIYVVLYLWSLTSQCNLTMFSLTFAMAD